MTTTFERFDDTPSRTDLALTLLPAIVAVAAAGTAPMGLVTGLAAAAVLLAGVRLGSRRLLTVGTIGLFAGVLVAGVRGVPVLQVTVGAAATVVAWDTGANAVGVARQLGARAATRRIQIVHALATTLVAGVIGAAAFAVFWLTRGGEPTAAVALLVLATLLFVLLLDR